ncbi:hypothetical protein BRADI_2g14497v3 [Brachypodium distachyon]|uniref:Uncharacterized protein n=1 Tax=Brachypodium distachyon TaxID=15368 RepID=A0A2K2D8M9_BRADI|nr:hypothetical protein BRADI_2g14497v3 [Brachypodium distachyon]
MAAAAILKMPLFLGALMIMAMFLSSQGEVLYKIGCFAGVRTASTTIAREGARVRIWGFLTERS